MSREEKFCKAEMHQENIELKLLSDQNQKLDSENPTDTLTESFGSNSDTLETNFSSNTFTKSSSKHESVYKRSSSYHGKSLKGFIKVVVFGVVFEVIMSSFLSTFTVFAKLYPPLSMSIAVNIKILFLKLSLTVNCENVFRVHESCIQKNYKVPT